MIFCKHKWKHWKDFNFDEELSKFHGVTIPGYTADDLAKRGIITVVQCEKCGKFKHIKTIL